MIRNFILHPPAHLRYHQQQLNNNFFDCCFLNSCFRFSSSSLETEKPPQKIISPADLAKKKARGESVDESSLTPRSRFNVSAHSGAKREALKLYRNLLKVSRQNEENSNVDVSGGTPKKNMKEKIDVQGLEKTTKKKGVQGVVLNAQQKYIREQFVQNRHIPRANIEKIQYHIHYGQTKLEELEKNKKHHRGFTVLTFGG